MDDIHYATIVVYGYAVWLAAAYAWDWHKNARRRNAAHRTLEQHVKLSAETPTPRSEVTSPQAADTHAGSPVQAI